MKASWLALPPTSSSSTRPSEAASRVCSQPAVARPVTRGLLAPALERASLVAGAGLVEDRRHDLEQLRRARVRLGGGPADERLLGLGGQQALDLALDGVVRDHHEPQRRLAAHAPCDEVEHVAEVAGDDLVDVALVARLRPAALVVPAGSLLGLVDDLVEPAAAEPEELSALAADDRDECAVAAPDAGDERREVELASEPDVVPDAAGKRHLAPEVVQARREEREPAQAGAVEVAAEVALDPVDVLPQRLLLVAGEGAELEAAVPAAGVEQRVDLRHHVARVDRRLRVEVEVERDRAPLGRPEAGELAKCVQRHRRSHAIPLAPRRRFYASAAAPRPPVRKRKFRPTRSV